VFTYETPNVKGEIERKFCPEKGHILAVFGVWGQGLEKVSILVQKAHMYVNPRRLSHFVRKLVWGCDLQVRWVGGENKVTRDRIFHIFTQKPPRLRSSPNLIWGQISRT